MTENKYAVMEEIELNEDSFDFEGIAAGLLDFKQRVDIFHQKLKYILSDFLFLLRT
jgi:hypothetical protein